MSLPARNIALAATTASRRLAQRDSGLELLRFAAVGATGYAVNLVVYAGLIHARLHYLAAAAGSFSVAVVNNYIWNRMWTFRAGRGSVYDQGVRFLVMSLCSLGVNLLLLEGLVGAHAPKLIAQGTAVILVTPLNFLASKLWVFARPAPLAG